MDSVLGQISRADHKWGKGYGKNGQATWWDNVKGKKGLNVRYDTLIKKAFNPELWNSKVIVDGYTQMELNFALFFGLAVQMYEATLVSDKTPFDRFMEGHDSALTQAQMEGLIVFANEGPGRSDLPIFAGKGQGSCSRCHGGAELTDASVANVSEEPIEVEEAAALGADGFLFIAEETVFLDNGFSNIGVRPTNNDLGRGAEAAPGLPFSFVRQNLAGFEFAPELPDECGGVDQPPCPIDNRAAVDGAFKIPSLRNVELTGPYFHNGGMATLEEVVEFYDRQGDFSDLNVGNLDRVMSLILLIEGDEDSLVEFLLSLTDPRVKHEMAPFDHPQLFVPNGHPGDHTLLSCINENGLQACDDLLEIPAIGAKGRWFAGLPPLGTFLDLEPVD
jgi:cytochrome c peroxidase